MEERCNPLRRARDAAGLTQEELAELIGSSERTVRRWERGELPSKYYQQRLCEVLATSLEELGFKTARQFARQDHPPQLDDEVNRKEEETYKVGEKRSTDFRPYGGCIPVLITVLSLGGAFVWLILRIYT